MLSKPDYLHFYLAAKNKYRLHSPFLYEFAMEVLEAKNIFYADLDIDRLLGLIKASNSVYSSHLLSYTAYKRIFRISKWYHAKRIISLHDKDLAFGAIAAYYGSRNAQILIDAENSEYLSLIKKHFSLLKIENEIESISKNLDNIHSKLTQKSLILLYAKGFSAMELESCLSQLPEQTPEFCIVITNMKTSNKRLDWLKLIKNTELGYQFIDLYDFGIIIKKASTDTATYTPMITFKNKWFQL